MNQIPLQVIYIVVIAEAFLCLVGMGSLCLTMFFKTYTDPAILTAIISITSGVFGSLTTILASPRQPIPGTTTTTSTVSTPAPVEPEPVTPPVVP